MSTVQNSIAQKFIVKREHCLMSLLLEKHQCSIIPEVWKKVAAFQGSGVKLFINHDPHINNLIIQKKF